MAVRKVAGFSVSWESRIDSVEAMPIPNWSTLRRNMTRIASIILTVITLLGAHAPAYAATAYLVKCETMSSPVDGRMVYVGTYRYGAGVFIQNFDRYCPLSIEVQ